VTAGSLLAIGAFLGANYHLKWGLLGEWDKPAFVVAISIGGLLLLRIMPVPIRRLE
jgi:alpha-beta hydrolase superfamily lysophospholipase